MSNIFNTGGKTYEDFFEEVWDYVSQHIVDDDLWENHVEQFQEVTFDLYKIYSNTSMNLPTGEVIPLVSTKVYARIIESFVKNFKNKLV